MGERCTVLAARYPWRGYWEEHFDCDELSEAIEKAEEYQTDGYEIVDIQFRNFNKKDKTK